MSHLNEMNDEEVDEKRDKSWLAKKLAKRGGETASEQEAMRRFPCAEDAENLSGTGLQFWAFVPKNGKVLHGPCLIESVVEGKGSSTDVWPSFVISK